MRNDASRSVLIGLVLLAGHSCRAQSAPIPLGKGTPQLFIDDSLIAGQHGVVRTLHRPHKDNGGDFPLIAAQTGDSLLAYGTIVFDDRLARYVMFLQDFPSRRMLRTTSPDGLHWDATRYEQLQPVQFDLNLPDVPAANRARFGIDLFSCCYDRRDTAYPYQGWLWLANCGNDLEGIFHYRSADGLNWERRRQVVQGFAGPGDPSCRRIDLPDRTLFGPGDVTLFSFDPERGRFLGIFKFFDPSSGVSNSSRSRAYAWVNRLDEPFDINRIERLDLVPPRADRGGDTRFDEYYASTAWRYGAGWLGGLKIFHAAGDYPFSAAGCAFLKLLTSRDGLHWHKVAFANDAGRPEVFIENGREGGNDGHNDGGYISEFSQGPLRLGDQLAYYYCCSSHGKNAAPANRVRGGGLFRAMLRPDGFVSVDAGAFTTPLLTSTADGLSVNAAGPVLVELLDEAGQSLGSTRLQGDSLGHPVRFAGRPLPELAHSGRFCLHFEVGEGGHLYSFTMN